MIEFLPGGWHVAYFQKAERLNRGDSGDFAQQAKFVPRLHSSALASYTTSQVKSLGTHLPLLFSEHQQAPAIPCRLIGAPSCNRLYLAKGREIAKAYQIVIV